MNAETGLRLIHTIEFAVFYHELNEKWHQNAKTDDLRPFINLEDHVFNLHYFNYSLWHEEDQARRADVSDKIIAQVKRNIDGYNQKRNDTIEKIDKWILAQLHALPLYKDGLMINSETPGSILDRISILSLKIYHMQEETVRTDVNEAHLEKCRKKVTILKEQQQDLIMCLRSLINDYASGNKSMNVYFQFKMYNDPELNQAIYKNK